MLLNTQQTTLIGLVVIVEMHTTFKNQQSSLIRSEQISFEATSETNAISNPSAHTVLSIIRYKTIQRYFYLIAVVVEAASTMLDIKSDISHNYNTLSFSIGSAPRSSNIITLNKHFF